MKEQPPAIEKVIRDGKVAVLYSPGFGAGWSTWNADNRILFHPKLVELVEAGRQNEITEEFLLTLGISDVYCGGAGDLTIAWLEEGTAFQVSEYDGSESIETMDNLTHTA